MKVTIYQSIAASKLPHLLKDARAQVIAMRRSFCTDESARMRQLE
jgi:hypothetical protein